MKLALHTPRSTRRGTTLVEILISMLILVILLDALGVTVLRSTGAYRQGMSSAVLEGQARRLLERIASEFADVDRTTLNPNPLAPFGTSTLSYRRCEGWAGGAIVLGPTRQIRLTLEPGELDNGIDDNHNGRIDERRVVLVPDTATPATTIGLGGWVREFAEGETPNGADDNGNGLVDERGLSFEHDGNGTLTIRLTLERLDPQGRPVDFTVQTAVHMRNNR
jgi:hypothetical protein